MPMSTSTCTFTSGTKGFQILGAAANDQIGFLVDGAGDVNGDGIDDVILGAQTGDPPVTPARTDAGIAYVIFGQDHSTATFADVDLSTFTTGSAGLRIFGATANDKLGTGVGRAGDVNGDGIDDIVVGAISASAAYVIFGMTTYSADIDLLSFTSGLSGFRMTGAASSSLGRSVSGAGDVNGDGFDDVPCPRL